MKKIIKYEAKIILCKPYVPILLLINFLYSYYLLSADIILGVSDTAPFSGWSFGKYMGSGVLWTFLLSLLILITSNAGRKNVAVLTNVTGISPKKLNLVRSLIVTAFFLLSCLLIFLLGCVFLQTLFQTIRIGAYLAAFLLTALPCAILIIGFGTVAGNLHPAFGYVLIVLLLAVSLFAAAGIGGGYLLDAAGASYYETVSGLLERFEASETPFVIRGGYVLARSLYACLGIAVFWFGYTGGGKKDRLLSRMLS